MSSLSLSAVMATLLAAASPTALSGTTTDYSAASTDSESASYPPSTDPAPAINPDEAAGLTDDSIQANGRNGSHSLHPAAPVNVDQVADDGVSSGTSSSAAGD
ncbi:MAG TPA: hypothetical protein VJS90_13230 [Pseudomonas sp.]|uniref:hypothetical protein n=1 Tax=Pseudomonas sp. TaxID=306 RepID=UPI002B4927C1|nr:hypothetical protein [Pseudomonas sp.]HKS13988.1 hypothetical protein [Pseudomonas sp.]